MARSFASVTVSEMKRNPRSRRFLVEAASMSFAKPGGAVFGEHAHLSDVPNVGTHPRTEDQADQRLIAALENHKGCLGIESAASGEAHDVVQESAASR